MYLDTIAWLLSHCINLLMFRRLRAFFVYWMLSNLSSKTLFGHFCKLRLMSLMGHILDLLDFPDEALVKRIQLQL
jgi:hypothetical protein